MMQKKIIISVLFSITLIYACHKKAMNHSSNKNIPTVENKSVSSEIKNVIIDSKINMTDIGASYIIDSTKMNEDILSIFVNYSGGCKTHSFELYSNKAYGKSLPPQVYICLKHTSNGDACRQLIYKELKFNISNLKYPEQNTVIVDLGNTHRIFYSTK